MKPGTILLEACINEPDGKFEWQEWHVRSIRKGVAHATIKIPGVTWGKLSKKHGDFGWLSSIPRYCRKSWIVAGGIPSYSCIATTRLGALQKAIRSQKEYGEDADYAGITNAEIVKKLETMLNRERSKRKTRPATLTDNG